MGKFKLKKGYYSEPTAIWFKMLGDFLNLIGAGASVSAIIQDEKTLAIIFIVIGALGKTITNGVTEIQSANEKNEE